MSGKLAELTMKTTVVRRVTVFFLFLGLIGLQVPSTGISRWSAIELPNTLPQGLYVDNDENIFCGSQTYERIQMYDKHGKFIRAFDTDIGKGSGYRFTFEVKNCQLHIHVYSAWVKSEHSDRKIIYSIDGNLLHVTDIPSVEDAGYKVNNTAVDNDGDCYTLKGIIFPRVVRTRSDGSSSLMIGTPFYLWPIQAPFPAFVIFFVSLLKLVGFQNFIRKRSSTY